MKITHTWTTHEHLPDRTPLIPLQLGCPPLFGLVAAQVQVLLQQPGFSSHQARGNTWWCRVPPVCPAWWRYSVAPSLNHYMQLLHRTQLVRVEGGRQSRFSGNVPRSYCGSTHLCSAYFLSFTGSLSSARSHHKKHQPSRPLMPWAPLQRERQGELQSC